ncbi:response regulator transcription factor [Natronomonas sp. EA1]|uniref:response regulator transcription factor n=1 Tax=Natronomonas sp. EA1 TaxID=3421655 RepID=UPI003EC0149F
MTSDTVEPADDTTTTEQPKGTVLAVDDQKRITQVFQLWLGDEYTVRTANSGEEAFDQLDDTVDVVLLDRQMPGVSGDEVLEYIREEGYDCRVAMITGVDPGFDIVDMPFDDYLQKPVDQETVLETVERLRSVGEYNERVQQFLSTAKKKATLESEKPNAALERDDRYQSLLDSLAEHQRHVDELVDEMGPEEFDQLFKSLPSPTEDADSPDEE